MATAWEAMNRLVSSQHEAIMSPHTLSVGSAGHETEPHTPCAASMPSPLSWLHPCFIFYKGSSPSAEIVIQNACSSKCGYHIIVMTTPGLRFFAYRAVEELSSIIEKQHPVNCNRYFTSGDSACLSTDSHQALAMNRERSDLRSVSNI